MERLEGNISRIDINKQTNKHQYKIFNFNTNIYINRSGDNEISFLQKTQTIIIEIFTFFIDTEQLVYETGL